MGWALVDFLSELTALLPPFLLLPSFLDCICFAFGTDFFSAFAFGAAVNYLVIFFVALAGALAGALEAGFYLGAFSTGADFETKPKSTEASYFDSVLVTFLTWAFLGIRILFQYLKYNL